MNKGTQVRLPVHIFDSRRELNKMMVQLRQVKGCEPTDQELASAMGVKVTKVLELKGLVPREPASLEDRVTKDDRTLKETLADPEQKMPEELVADKEMSRKIRSVLFKLAPMERDIIARRFGFTYETETLEEIGKSYNLSRERVRQIQVQGIKSYSGFARKSCGLDNLISHRGFNSGEGLYLWSSYFDVLGALRDFLVRHNHGSSCHVRLVAVHGTVAEKVGGT